jgi:hypothetical protein
VVLVDVRDLLESYFKAGEQQELLAYLNKLTLDRGREVPPRIRISCIIISNDLVHDTAAVQHYTSMVIQKTKSLKHDNAEWSRVHIFSDGCRAQLKNMNMFLWMSMMHMLGFAHVLFWNFFCSCHGKSWGDPEGGALKQFAMEANVRGVESGNPTPLRNALDICAKACDSQSNFLRPRKSYYSKKGMGIHSRIPMYCSKTDINRKIATAKEISSEFVEWSSHLHQFMTSRTAQKLTVRERSHNDCGSCTANDWATCPAQLRAEIAREVTVVSETATAPMQLRQQRHRAQLATRPGVVGSFAAIECDGTVHIPSDNSFDPLAYGFFATDPYLIGMVMVSYIVDKEQRIGGSFWKISKK